MMPSRGLNIANGRAPRLIRQQCRNLSTTPRPHLRVSHKANAILHTSRPWTRTIPASAASIPAIRHASWFSWGKKETDAVPQVAQPTASTPPPPPAASEPIAAAAPTATPETPPTASTSPPVEAPVDASSHAFPNLDTIVLDSETAPNIADLPERIGYLKEIGLDYGWGPTAVAEWVIEHMHISLGLPWWASIVAAAVLLRATLFPLFVKSSDSMARQAAMSSVLKPISDRMMEAKKAGDNQAMTQAWQHMGAVRKRAGIRFRDSLIPPLFQAVLGYGGYKFTHAAATLPVPGFKDGGFLWLQDLTMTDGYLLLPLLMAGTMHLVIRLGGESGGGSAAQLPASMKNFMLYGMPVIVAGFISFQPGAVCVWFASTGIFGIAQAQLLMRPKVREFLGIAPMYKPKPGEGSTMFDSIDSMFGQKKQQQHQTAQQSSAYQEGYGLGRKLAAERDAQKNVEYMNPTYQMPNLNTRPSRSKSTIDTTLVTPSETSTTDSDMVQPGRKS